MKSGTCSVCSHPQRTEIEQAHLAGVPMREIGKRFDRSKTTIAAHIKLHVPEAAPGPAVTGVEKRAKPKKSKAHACKAPALLAVQPTPVEAADVKHDSPVPKKPVTGNHIRDVAWRVGEPVAQIEEFDLETVAIFCAEIKTMRTRRHARRSYACSVGLTFTPKTDPD